MKLPSGYCLIVVAITAVSCATPTGTPPEDAGLPPAPASAFAEAQSIDPDVAAAESPASSSKGVSISVDEEVNVRRGPGTDFDVVAQLTPNQTYYVTGKSGEWFQIQLDDGNAWVYAAFTRLKGDPVGIPDLSLPSGSSVSTVPIPQDQQAATTGIRTIVSQPTLGLRFIEITTMANSPNGDLPVARYSDTQGREFLVELQANTVVQISQTGTSLAALGDASELARSELALKAQEFVSANTPGFSQIRGSLNYTEGTKGGSMYFFRWEDRTSSDWRLNRPFAQVGLSITGDIVTYINTLGLR